MAGVVREDTTKEGRRIWKLVEKVAATAPKDAALQSDQVEIDEIDRKASSKRSEASARPRRAR
jgi:hypothetical protein